MKKQQEHLDIAKTIRSMAGKYSTAQIFADWVKCCALSIANSCVFQRNKLWQKREEEYLDTVNKYTREEIDLFVSMFASLVIEMDQQPRDILGKLYFEVGIPNISASQFFTPDSISELMGALTMSQFQEGEVQEVYDPCCGSGSNLIGAIVHLMKRGINYQKYLSIIAQDIDVFCIYMCYIQLSLLGVKAICVQGNTITEPYTGNNYPKERVFKTPAQRGLLLGL